MANPRQRRKARSSSHRPVSHSRHTKKNLKKVPPIRGPKALQDAWDRRKTVRQNYANLGLLVTSDPSAHGGIEKPLEIVTSVQPSDKQELSASSPIVRLSKVDVPSGFGRIIRDGTGNVLGVDLNATEALDAETDHLENISSPIDHGIRQKWTMTCPPSTASHFCPRNVKLIEDLEQVSASATGSTTLSIPISGIGSRHASSSEIRYLQPLIKKYGSDFDLMSVDLKLNPEQRTVGQLKRAIGKATFSKS